MALSRPLADPLVAARMRVLGQPVRLRLIDRLDELAEARVQALAEHLGLTQQNTSKHLGVLWRAGILTRRQQGRETIYALADQETFAVIERVAIGIAAQLRGLGDDPDRAASGKPASAPARAAPPARK